MNEIRSGRPRETIEQVRDLLYESRAERRRLDAERRRLTEVIEASRESKRGANELRARLADLFYSLSEPIK